MSAAVQTSVSGRSLQVETSTSPHQRDPALRPYSLTWGGSHFSCSMSQSTPHLFRCSLPRHAFRVRASLISYGESSSTLVRQSSAISYLSPTLAYGSSSPRLGLRLTVLILLQQYVALQAPLHIELADYRPVA